MIVISETPTIVIPKHGFSNSVSLSGRNIAGWIIDFGISYSHDHIWFFKC